VAIRIDRRVNNLAVVPHDDDLIVSICHAEFIEVSILPII